MLVQLAGSRVWNVHEGVVQKPSLSMQNPHSSGQFPQANYDMLQALD